MKRSGFLMLVLLAAGCGSGTVSSGDPEADASTSSKRDSGYLPWDAGYLDQPDAWIPPPYDAGLIPTDGGSGPTDAGLGVYADAEVPVGDAGCPTDPCQPVAGGCGGAETCSDGLDNNCNGQIDENCACTPGKVQRCFLGPPARRGLGVCADGQQTCQGSGEFGRWGDCVGGIWPSIELCDDADNNCDGCADENLCCQTAGSCPSNQDPRVPVGRAFQEYRLDGSLFFFGTARSWEWKIEGGPCDRMLYASKQVVSYEVPGATTDPRIGRNQALAFTPTLSGDYTVTMKVTQTDDTVFECTFIVPIRQPGMRVELCWDRTGEDDIDLWLHRPNTSGDWAKDDQETCYYTNCKNTTSREIDWLYPPTSGGSCLTPLSVGCHNPRLDIDNISTEGKPENINIDVPRNGETFRVGVNFYGCQPDLDPHPDVHPMVNVYCGGELMATYGGAQVGSTLYGSSAITGFDTPGSDSRGSLWRVVDVTMHEPSDSCTLTGLVPNGAASGACIDTSTDRSYDGPCRRQ